MEEKTLGKEIARLRKEQNMTQQDLANKLNITDKAVSKWERNLSYPDITSLSDLAKILKVDTSYLIDLCKKEQNPYQNKEDINNIIDLILVVLPFALSISTITLNIIDKLSTKDLLGFISISIFSISIYNLRKHIQNKKS